MSKRLLRRANLREVDLGGADLSAADLHVADLQNAIAGKAVYSQNTVLPDGTMWTPDTDMARFTDPDHPEFWQPEWVRKGEHPMWG